MPIRAFIGDASFTPDDIEAINNAFSAALAQLGLADRQDPLAEIVARKIIEVVRLGERNPSAFVSWR
jgi:hypothetical protein